MEGNFSGHYEPWIHRRIEVITAHFGHDWFAGTHILELGCGYAAIGDAMSRLGAHVTCSDARQEHLDAIRSTKPHLQLVLHDLDDGQWPYDSDYDLILHTGVLYHLKNYRPSIEHCLRSCRHLFLETEVLDSDADEVLLVEAIDNTRHWRHGLRRAWFVEGLSGASVRNRLKRLASSYMGDSSQDRRIA
jgi:2-polyprenyl-3-methyl-5-hydroxy-6-metoxy-1,4-benzoquinol methylase